MDREERASRLAHLKERALTLAAIIEASPTSPPRFGASNDSGAPYIDYDGLYRFVAQERDVERDHRMTLDEDELLYWIFEGITFGMAGRYELQHRVPYQDFRRILFEHQLELIAKLNTKWKERREFEQKETLSRHPFHDQSAEAASGAV